MSHRKSIPRFARRRKPPETMIVQLADETDADAFELEYSQAVGGGANTKELAEIRKRHGVTIVGKSKGSN